jgi:2-polyprenyl-3-methyl-5-hydroxy-6-metoxy-1,4-benzoquinol methylase
MMLKRDRQPEWMDDPSLSRADHLAALAGLARLNRLSGVGRLMYRHIRRQAMARANRRLTLLDVASGAGDIPISWVLRARREGWTLQVTMTDTRALALEEQQRRARRCQVDVLSLQHDCLHSPLPGGFDVVTSSLFMHHLDDHQVFCLLQSMQSASDGALVLCDLERSRTNLLLVKTAAAAISRSPVVHHDADASVRAAFTVEEFRRVAEAALVRPIRVSRAFPCRFIACQEEVTVADAVPAFA